MKLSFIKVNLFAHTLAFGQCHNMCDCLNRRYVWNYSHPTVGLPSSNALDCYSQAICYSRYLSLGKGDPFLIYIRRKEIAFLHGNVAVLALVASEE